MKRLLICWVALTALLAPRPALAQSEPFISQIAVFGANFCPRGWLPTDGRLLPIAQNTALFSLLGTTYGGNGQTTFALPILKPVPSVEGSFMIQCIAVQGIFPPRN